MATDVLDLPRIKPQREFAGILKDHEPFGHGDPDDLGDRLNGWFDRLMLQSGVGTSPGMMLAVCACAAAALGGLGFVIREDPLSVALGGLCGFVLPVVVVAVLRSRRQRQLNDQLPSMIDELARAARTGRSLDSCLKLVAQDTAGPLGDELRGCTRRLDLGLSVAQAVSELPARTGLVSMSVLTTALAVHEATGGDLVRVLERLARTIRDRAQFLGRLHASTAASKWTALLMLGLPVAIVGFFLWRDPEYVSNLMDSRWGFRATITAVLLQVIGSLLVLRILSRSQRA